VAVHHLLLGLARGQCDLGGVDDDDVVAGVDVLAVRRLVLPTEHAGHLGRHAAERQAFGVDDEPGVLDL
jgi:hypothetical protein